LFATKQLFANVTETIGPIAGAYLGALDNSGERLRLVDASNEEVLDFHYNPDWHAETDGLGAALLVLSEAADPDAWGSKPIGPHLQPVRTTIPITTACPTRGKLRHALDPHVPDGDRDLDHDGMSNLAEFMAGTDPNDGQSYLKLEVKTHLSPGLTLEFVAAPEHSYTIEFSDVLDGTPWEKFRDVDTVPAVESPWDDASASVHRYYRIITPKR
jgi:hypothetical protein